jgi:hypothetical protein
MFASIGCPTSSVFDFKILFAIIFILISDEIFQLSHVIFVIQFLSRNTKCESCTRRVPIFSLHVTACHANLHQKSTICIVNEPIAECAKHHGSLVTQQNFST